MKRAMAALLVTAGLALSGCADTAEEDGEENRDGEESEDD